MFNKILNLFSNNKQTNETKSVLPMPDISYTEEKDRPEYLTKTEQDIRDLGIAATQLKDQGNWEKAIECLQKQKELMPLVKTEFTPQNYMRLPKFLQQAGRMPEAIVECDFVLNNIQSSYKVQAYNDMRIIYNREKKNKEAYYYGRLSDAWQAIMYKSRTSIAPENSESIDFWKKNINSHFKKQSNEVVNSKILALFETHLVTIENSFIEFKKNYKTPPKEKYSYIKDPEKLSRRKQRDFEKSLDEYLMIEGNNIVSAFDNALKSELNIQQ